MEDLQKGFVDVRLALETVLDLVDVVDGVVELHWLIVLNRRSGGGTAERLVELHGRGPRRGVRRDGRIALTARCQCLRLERLWKTSKMICFLPGNYSEIFKKTLKPILIKLALCHCVWRCIFRFAQIGSSGGGPCLFYGKLQECNQKQQWPSV